MADDKRFAERTDPDVRDWTKRLFDAAIENKHDIIFEGTMRNKWNAPTPAVSFLSVLGVFDLVHKRRNFIRFSGTRKKLSTKLILLKFLNIKFINSRSPEGLIMLTFWGYIGADFLSYWS